jgi:hypothetical protein
MAVHPIIKHADTVRESHDKNIRRGTYPDRGRSIGAGLGAVAGLSSGITAKKIYGAKGRRAAAGVGMLTAAGAIGGAAVGEIAGTLVRRKQPLQESKNFSTMNHTTRTLVNLSARLDSKLEGAGVINFSGDPRKDEKPSALKRAAVVAGAGALAAGGLYARGRLARNGGKWGSTKAPGRFASDTSGPSVGQTVVSDLKRGFGMTKNDVTSAAGKVGDMWRNRKTARGAVDRMGNVRQLTNVTPA